MATIAKIWCWITKNIWLVLIGLGLMFIGILVLLWRHKNSTIKRLQCELFIAHSKIQIQDLAKKYVVSMTQFMTLREHDKELDSALEKIEKDLAEKVDPTMTAEEIAERFRKLGVKP
jgi:LPXTG-motif cell wall-anchored protein